MRMCAGVARVQRSEPAMHMCAGGARVQRSEPSMRMCAGVARVQGVSRQCACVQVVLVCNGVSRRFALEDLLWLVGSGKLGGKIGGAVARRGSGAAAPGGLTGAAVRRQGLLQTFLLSYYITGERGGRCRVRASSPKEGGGGGRGRAEYYGDVCGVYRTTHRAVCARSALTGGSMTVQLVLHQPGSIMGNFFDVVCSISSISSVQFLRYRSELGRRSRSERRRLGKRSERRL